MILHSDILEHKSLHHAFLWRSRATAQKLYRQSTYRTAENKFHHTNTAVTAICDKHITTKRASLKPFGELFSDTNLAVKRRNEVNIVCSRCGGVGVVHRFALFAAFKIVKDAINQSNI